MELIIFLMRYYKLIDLHYTQVKTLINGNQPTIGAVDHPVGHGLPGQRIAASAEIQFHPV